MAELAGRRILLVEDEYMLASDLAEFLERHGTSVVGPVGSVSEALALVDATPIDAAVLDVNLRDERVYPVADVLIGRGVPIVFATGYDELLLQRPYLGLPRCQKPIDKPALLKTLQAALGTQNGGTNARA
jgi:DNA-binding response OmpR family regulator